MLYYYMPYITALGLISQLGLASRERTQPQDYQIYFRRYK